MKVLRFMPFLVVVGVGCGGGTGATAGTGGTTGSGVALAAFSAKYAEALCAQNFKCVPASDLSGHTMQDCVDTNKCALDFLASSIGNAQARGRATYNPVQMAACIAAIAQIPCADWDKGFALTTQPAVCATAVMSKVALGGACLDDVECTTRFCHGEDPSMNVQGACTDASSLGMTCASSADCASGFYCDVDAKTCAAQKVAGSACSLHMECLTSCNSAEQCSSYAGCTVGGAAPGSGALGVLAAAAAILLALGFRPSKRAAGSTLGPIRRGHDIDVAKWDARDGRTRDSGPPQNGFSIGASEA